jgi:hypothetical protein
MAGWGSPGSHSTDLPSSQCQARDEAIPSVAVRIPTPWHPRLVWVGVQVVRVLRSPPEAYDRRGVFSAWRSPVPQALHAPRIRQPQLNAWGFVISFLERVSPPLA